MMNKDIKLCGIGNALVDMQFEVTEKEISDLGLEKGTMTLVVDDVQETVLKMMGNRTKYISSGGSAANTIIAFSSFGGKAAYKTMIGEDEDGVFYVDEFQDLGIILDAAIDDDDHTGRCLVLITPDSERTMLTSLGATQNYNKDFVSDDLIKRSEWLYIEG
ncbi:MAG: PfkB family carbohydrate kinase, partial [Candidatus Kapaibacterium sp.]